MALGRKPIEIVNEGKHQLLGKAKHWERIYLKEIAKVQNGFAFSSSSFVKTGGLPLIRIRDIDRQSTVDRYNGIYSNDFIVRKGDILIGMDGDFKAAIWKGENALLNQRVCRIIPNSIRFNPKFLFLCLQPYLQAINEETSSVTVKHLSSRTIEEIPLPFPPLNEQQAIVSKIEELFSELDNGKQQLFTAQQQLKVYRQSLLKAAFEGKLTAAWREEQKRKGNENLAMVAEPEITYLNNRELPEGWKMKNLKSICSITGGVTKGKDYGGKKTVFLPYLRVANVQDGYLDLDVIKTIEVLPSDLEKYRLMPGDVLYTEGGDKDKLGRGTIWENEIENCIHQNHIFRARPISSIICSKFLSYFSQTKLAKDYFYNHGKQTTNLASINLTILSNLPIPIPPMEEQIIIVERLESKLTVCDKIEETIAQSLQQVESLRQSILKRAFEGRLV